MPDWNSPAEISKDGVVFSRFMHALLGLYIWEWFTSLDFDWDYIRGKRQFRWPLIFYFLNRYCLLFALIGIAVALNVATEINCQALYTFNQCVGNAAIGLASINFSLRTMAVWTQKWYIVVPLILLILGQWSLLLHGILLKATYSPTEGCVIVETDSRLLLAGFTYTMCFDFVVLSLTAWKLVINAPSSKVMGRSRLVVLIFGDGLIYFIIAFLSNLLATIFMLLDLNPVMSIIANVPSAIGSTIVACRAVRRLALFTSSGPEMFASTQASTLAFRSNTKSTMRPPRLNTTLKSEGVHVQMETFESPSSGGTYTDPVYDAMGKIIDQVSPAEEYDLEAQDIRNEFKRPPY
ncbi:MAG: hypothetical protein NXY57DRAFT_722543 [Lentinula lateritia]|uniref:Transmembrane protein n=1 Tax=Lentinula lateritia TaxID=40482 RepID=A0ABQ8VGC9_9AGAR|nr:MAG: hypothetical protein NXY57DRAFT_722543 [Lentinula lateritia]KAJ4488603.1 hypothetical protein C8R41DRAFT_403276 [Lentinula lateritia]